MDFFEATLEYSKWGIYFLLTQILYLHLVGTWRENAGVWDRNQHIL